MSFDRARLAPLAAALVTAFVACVWLNQSVGGKDWEAIRDRVHAHQADLLTTARYPLLFLYRRAPDELLYEGTAAAILGRPYDPAAINPRGTSSLPPVQTPVDGRWHAPYREVPLEYPPPALPFILAPKLVTRDFEHYAYAFGALMGGCLLAGFALTVRVRRAMDPRAVPWKLWGLASLALLAHGAIAIQRLDAIVALLLALAFVAAVERRPLLFGLWMGLATATKITPALVVPVMLAADGSFWRSARPLARGAIGFSLGALVGLGPMVLASPQALADLVRYHAARGLHAESCLGVLYGAAKVLAGCRERATLDYGSFNFHGPTADLLAKLAGPLTILLVAGVAWAFASRSASDAAPDDDLRRLERLACAMLASLLAVWLGGKVFSPQYLTWALPFLVVIPGRLGQRVAVAALAALLLGQLYLRAYFDHVYDQRPLGVVTMIVRLAVLVGWLVLVLPRREQDGRGRVRHR